MAQMNPRINVSYTDEATIVTFLDEKILEEKDVRELDEALASLIEQANGINLVLNFANVRFMSSAVLGLLIKVSKRVYEHGGRLALCAISPKIYEIFKITRLTKIFDVYRDTDTAAKHLTEQEQ
ncbi:MAG: STAS domain-containing protein [Phycisphaerae bacterium]|jgi:anti-anti-sigma factor